MSVAGAFSGFGIRRGISRDSGSVAESFAGSFAGFGSVAGPFAGFRSLRGILRGIRDPPGDHSRDSSPPDSGSLTRTIGGIRDPSLGHSQDSVFGIRLIIRESWDPSSDRSRDSGPVADLLQPIVSAKIRASNFRPASNLAPQNGGPNLVPKLRYPRTIIRAVPAVPCRGIPRWVSGTYTAQHRQQHRQSPFRRSANQSTGRQTEPPQPPQDLHKHSKHFKGTATTTDTITMVPFACSSHTNGQFYNDDPVDLFVFRD